MDKKIIDKLIAEKVMEWEISDKYPFHGPGWCIPFDGQVMKFLPTEKIDDAWLIVDKWADEGTFFSIHKWIDGQFVAKLETDKKEQNFEIQAEGHTAQIAICLVALKAVGVEVN